MQTHYGTKKENRKTIARLAQESLADHKIIPEQTEGPVQMWFCGKPHTGNYSYRVISAPSMLSVLPNSLIFWVLIKIMLILTFVL